MNNKKIKTLTKKRLVKFHIFPILILCSICFLGIGYGAMNGIALNISVTTSANPQNDIFISNVQPESATNATGEITQYYSNMLKSVITLADETSMITYAMQIYNNTAESSTFLGIEYGDDFYTNKDIVYTLNGLEVGRKISPKETISFKITFEYMDNLETINAAPLESYLKFAFGTPKSLIDALKDGEIQVGAYVDYENPIGISYTSPSSQTGMGYDQIYTTNNNGNEVRWRILGLSEDGQNILLTSDTAIQRNYDTSADINNTNSSYSIQTNSPYFYLSNAKGVSFDYGLAELDKICAIYKNDLAQEVRSLTVDDINRFANVTVDVANKKVYKTYDTTQTNIDTLGKIGTVLSLTSTSSKPQYSSPEDYINGNASSYTLTSDAYQYTASAVLDTNSEIYDVLFNNTGASGGMYWLKSRGIFTYSGASSYGLGAVVSGIVSTRYKELFYTDARYESGNASGNPPLVRYCGVRPIVILKSDISVTDIQVISE